MKKRFLWMLAAILICGTSTMLTSCSDKEDNPVEPSKSVAEAICGSWYAIQEFSGSLNGLSCRYVGQAAMFNEDGTGIWYFFLLNDAKQPLYVMGGKSKDYGHFHYTVDKDGTISISLDTDPTKHVWTMKYLDGKVIAPLQPDVVTTQVVTRSATRAEAAGDVITLKAASIDEIGEMEGMDGAIWEPAVVTFMLKDTNGNPIETKSMIVSADGGHYSIQEETTLNEWTVLMNPVDNKTLIISAQVGSDTYVMTKRGVKFPKGDNRMEATLTKVEAVQLWKDGPKFANMNLSATSEAEYGGYYAWAATTDFKQMWVSYDWNNTPYFTGNASVSQIDGNFSWSKYSGEDDYILQPEDDAATVNWGSGWRIPSLDEMKPLSDAEICKIERMIIGDYGGYKITGLTKGYTDKSIFLPAGEIYLKSDLLGHVEPGTHGVYWTSIRRTSEGLNRESSAWALDIANTFDPNFIYFYEWPRCYGLAIRPVKK